METLRCPTCFCLLPDGGRKRCPACRARIRANTARSAAGAGVEAPARRPLQLVEAELQARIEAETATHFRERRRAAKQARRIAALPPTLFQDDGAQAEAEHWSPRSTPPSPTIIDLPDTAVREVSPSRATVAWPAPKAEPREPLQVAEALVEEPAPSAPARRRRRRAERAQRAAEPAEPRMERDDEQPPRAPVESIVALAPEPVVALAPEPVVAPDPVVPTAAKAEREPAAARRVATQSRREDGPARRRARGGAG